MWALWRHASRDNRTTRELGLLEPLECRVVERPNRRRRSADRLPPPPSAPTGRPLRPRSMDMRSRGRARCICRPRRGRSEERIGALLLNDLGAGDERRDRCDDQRTTLPALVMFFVSWKLNVAMCADRAGRAGRAWPADAWAGVFDHEQVWRCGPGAIDGVHLAGDAAVVHHDDRARASA